MDSTILAQSLASLPRAQTQVLPALLLVQHSLGYVPDWAVKQIAPHVQMTPSQVEGVVTSYPDLRRTPPAAHTVRVCTGASCLANGAADLLEQLNAATRFIPATQADDWLEIGEADCCFICGVAPVVEVDEVPRGRVSRADLQSLLQTLLDDKSSPAHGEGAR